MSSNRVLATMSLELVPRNLPEVLTAQRESVKAIQPFASLGSGEAEYLQEVDDAIEAFVWSQEQTEARLLGVAVFDPRIRASFWAKIGGAISADRCTDYEGIVTPTGIYVAQLQLGPKWNGVAPHDCRTNFAPCEQGMTVREILNIGAIAGFDFLKVCRADLAGSVSGFGGVPSLPGFVYGSGFVPCLCLEGGPCLYGRYDYAVPNHGSASRGSVVPLGA